MVLETPRLASNRHEIRHNEGAMLPFWVVPLPVDATAFLLNLVWGFSASSRAASGSCDKRGRSLTHANTRGEGASDSQYRRTHTGLLIQICLTATAQVCVCGFTAHVCVHLYYLGYFGTYTFVSRLLFTGVLVDVGISAFVNEPASCRHRG